MKKIIFVIIITIIICCKNKSSDKEFRNEIDRIKKEKLPNENLKVTTFEFDSIKNEKFFSEITNTSNLGNKSVKVITEYSKSDKSLGKIENGPFKNAIFLNQKIMTDKNGKQNLFYLLEAENETIIYEIKYINKSLIKSLVKPNDSQWNIFETELRKE